MKWYIKRIRFRHLLHFKCGAFWSFSSLFPSSEVCTTTPVLLFNIFYTGEMEYGSNMIRKGEGAVHSFYIDLVEQSHRLTSKGQSLIRLIAGLTKRCLTTFSASPEVDELMKLNDGRHMIRSHNGMYVRIFSIILSHGRLTVWHNYEQWRDGSFKLNLAYDNWASILVYPALK